MTAPREYEHVVDAGYDDDKAEKVRELPKEHHAVVDMVGKRRGVRRRQVHLPVPENLAFRALNRFVRAVTRAARKRERPQGGAYPAKGDEPG